MGITVKKKFELERVTYISYTETINEFHLGFDS